MKTSGEERASGEEADSADERKGLGIAGCAVIWKKISLEGACVWSQEVVSYEIGSSTHKNRGGKLTEGTYDFTRVSREAITVLRSFTGVPRQSHGAHAIDMHRGMQSTHLNRMIVQVKDLRQDQFICCVG
jgi:hypothetical protein